MDQQPDLPFRTDDLEGISGEIKVRPGDFAVEEVPLYEPDDDGQHVYVKLTRTGRTTREIVDALAELFDVPKRTIGYAGLKDRRAEATQRFSLDTAEFSRPKPDDDEVADRVAGELEVEVAYARRHRNKLRRGHLVGNRFRIVVAGAGSDEDVQRTGAVAEALVERGVPNFYGAQRFGDDGDNAARGLEILKGGDWSGPHWKRELMLNAYQAELFNRWLVARLEEDVFDGLLEGDIAKKTDTGGLFEVEELAREQPRFENREITFTGPIFGGDLWWPGGAAGEFEERILEESEATEEAFSEAGLSGSRRRGRIHLESIEAASVERGLELRFGLPKGAYATVVLREFLRE